MGLTYYCMATCDNCSTTSDLVEAATTAGAMLELESDKWSIMDQLLLCPRCVADV